MLRVLERLSELRGLPEVLVTDNGPEFAGQALDVWAYERGVKLHFIQPASRFKTLSSRVSMARCEMSA